MEEFLRRQTEKQKYKGKMDGERGEDHETLKPRLISILNLTLVASIGGFVFGYYVGYIIAQFGVLNNLDSILHEIVRTGLVGTILGATAGGWTNDSLGRKYSILIADAFIFFGAIALVFMICMGDDFFSNCYMDTIGNTFIAFGVGMTSMSSPLYISEFSPPKLRNILLSINFILYGIGKLIFFNLYNDSILPSSYLITLTGLTALYQFSVMLSFPESPIWLYKKDQKNDVIKVLETIYTCCEVGKEYDAFKLLISSETTDEHEPSYSGRSIFSKVRIAWSSPLVRRQFGVGTCLLAAQQLVGINVLIYFIPSIHRMSGFGPSDTDILFINRLLRASYGIPPIFGGFCCTFYLVVRVRKRKMLRWGLYWMLGGVLGLSFLFMVSPGFTEAVSRSESTIHFKNNTCLSYITAPDTDSWDCLTCLQASTGCGFCRGTHYNILGHSNGACLIAESNGTSKVCIDENRFWSTKHCEPNVFSRLVFLSFVIYTFSYSGSLEIVPWIINSQFYPIEVRGVYGGMAAATNWFFFLVIILLSFFFNSTLGPVFTFLLISLLSFCVLLLIKSFVPENTGFFTSARKRKRD